MHPAIFLDRDGVIIENRPAYVRSWEDVEIFPQALTALARVCKSPYKIVIVTNQSGVGRGLIQMETAEEINRRLVREIEKAGGRIDAVLMCPHAPEDRCGCRKPLPGLFFQAARQLQIDLSRSVMIGDAVSDLQAGKAAGIPRRFLVRTGRGAIQENLPEIAAAGPFTPCDTLEEALSRILLDP
ncbi:MAG: HAD-IIIA family hydrolase [Chloroflexi bacterium]|jgi:D-glycero-D-manno-heptose 1,7-bisphosphate phosphatase|nr:HAD-IIIA family hydrolase [Chloroflexota bacterium]